MFCSNKICNHAYLCRGAKVKTNNLPGVAVEDISGVASGHSGCTFTPLNFYFLLGSNVTWDSTAYLWLWITEFYLLFIR